MSVDQPPRPSQPLTFNKPCVSCGQDMTYIMPIPRIFNAIDVSSIVFVHNRPDKCGKCGTMFLPIVEGFDEGGALQFKWMVVANKRQPMIVGGDQNTLRQAIEQAQFTERIKNN